jgi:hypothetical protein
MFITPSLDDLLEGVVTALTTEVMPYVTNPKAQATVGMMQAVLQMIRQELPVYDRYIADEHNGMVTLFRELPGAIADATGPAADRIRARAAEVGGRQLYREPDDRAEMMAAHRACSQAIVDTLVDIDGLQRAGEARADAALQLIRSHLGPRYVRDFNTLMVGAGMIGRG